MRIKILTGMGSTYEVRVVDAEGRALRSFTYRTIESARRAAAAWRLRRLSDRRQYRG